MTPIPTTTLRPRWAIPVALFVCAFIMGWPAFAFLKFGLGKELWWVVALLGGFAAFLLYVSAHGFVTRRLWVMKVSDDVFEVFGHRIGRARVTRVSRHVGLGFKGVRIELDGGGWINIPVHLHRPRKLLSAFKRHGYPVLDRR